MLSEDMRRHSMRVSQTMERLASLAFQTAPTIPSAAAGDALTGEAGSYGYMAPE